MCTGGVRCTRYNVAMAMFDQVRQLFVVALLFGLPFVGLFMMSAYPECAKIVSAVLVAVATLIFTLTVCLMPSRIMRAQLRTHWSRGWRRGSTPLRNASHVPGVRGREQLREPRLYM